MSNYYLPAEWQEQFAVQLTWPHAYTDWANNGLLEEINEYFISLAKNILKYQNLIITAYDSSHKGLIESCLGKNKFDYHVYICPSNDTWARDHGPISLLNDSLEDNSNSSKLILDYNFNAWGSKFDFSKDNLITSNLYQQKAYPSSGYTKINYILEGGSIDSDGKGTVLTTASCILNKNRNHDLSEQEIITELKQYLNIEKLIILKNSFLYGDDTDGHIDMIARFTSPNTIVYTACDNPNNPNYESLTKLELELKDLKAKRVLSSDINLIPLYIPDMIYLEDNNKDLDNLLPASYVNFLIINKAVLVPTYNDTKFDDLALHTFKQLFPDRDIIGLNSRVAIKQGGSLHCLTMQIPK
jgi:agmatine deiminase